MRRVGVYGGTFNPIHNGHLHILGEFLARLSLDKVLLIPTGNPPHKEAPELVGAEDRLKMCELAVDEAKINAEVSDIEIKRTGKSYTVDTLEALHAENPEDELFLLMGEDMFLTLDKWYCPERIFELATVCVSPRSHGLEKLEAFARELANRFGATAIIENISYLEISSTQIRERIKAGESIEGLAPSSTEEYIKRNKLYL